MKDMEVIFNNTYYTVLVNRKANKYIIVNKLTKIIEDEASKLPTAIGLAKAMEAALLKLIKEDKNGSEESKPY